MALANKLINRISYIQEAGESYNNSNILKDRKQEIENFLIPFNEVREKFNIVINAFIAMRVISPSNIVDLTSIQNHLEQLKNKVIYDEYDKALSNTIKRELDRTYNELLRLWKSYISERVSSIDSVLETLGNLISDMPEKKVLQDKRHIFSNSSIGNRMAIAAIEEYVSTYNVLMDKLNLSENILAFLKLLTSGNAVTLNDMNADVYDWIKTSGFASKINLKI